MPSQWRQKRSAIRHYDRIAETYDEQYAEEQNLKIITALKALPQPINKNAKILDAGCGTGTLFPHITQYARLIAGIDTSRNLLKKAKKKTHPSVALIRADADTMPFKEGVFTHTFAFTLLQNQPRPEKTLTEIRRVTRKNAILIVTALKKHFTQSDFTHLLENARLDASILKTDNELKDFIAICRKKPMTPSASAFSGAIR